MSLRADQSKQKLSKANRRKAGVAVFTNTMGNIKIHHADELLDIKYKEAPLHIYLTALSVVRHKVPSPQISVAMHRLSIVQGDASGVCPAAATALAPYVVGLQVDSPCYLAVAGCTERLAA